MLHHGLLNDESSETAVRFHSLNDRRHFQKLTKSLSSVLRHGKLLAKLKIDLLNLLVICIGNINHLSAVGFNELLHMISYGLLRSLLPVITVDNIVGMDKSYYIVVHHIFLDHYLGDALDGTVKLHSFFLGNGRELVVADQCLIGQSADDDSSLLTRLVDYIKMTVVDNIGTKTSICCLHLSALLIDYGNLNAC